MLSIKFYSVQVPVLIPDVESFIDSYIDSYERWLDIWADLWRPPVHEVLDFPIQLPSPPAQPAFDPENLPKDVARIHA